jgi:hypothetical protein
MPPLVTDRDLEILATLERFPLTALQLLKLSRTFALPFTEERRVRERLQVLAVAGRVRRWRYAIAGPGAPAYFTLSPTGWALLHGVKADAASKRAFAELGVARQFHSFALAEFLVHFFVAAHAAGHEVLDFEREHACRLQVGTETLCPDAGFRLRLKSGRLFRYFVELDNSTERVRSLSVPDTWQRKLRLYERFAATTGERFRLLIVTTKSKERLEHLLAFAGAQAANKQRSLACGTFLPEFLAALEPLCERCFLDQQLAAAALLPPLKLPNEATRENGDLAIPDLRSARYHGPLAAARTAAV